MNNFIPFILHHWPLWVALVVILSVIFVNEWILQKKRPSMLSPSMTVHQINHNSALIIDIRTKDEFQAGHITDSINELADSFTQQRMDKYKSKPLIIVCSKGIDSMALATKLRAEGFINPMVLEGGIAGWRTAGLPLIKGKK